MSKSISNSVPILIVAILILLLIIIILTLLAVGSFAKGLEVATQIGIFIVLLLTLIPIRNNYAAQLLRDRYQMFFDSWQVNAEDIDQFRIEPRLFVDQDKMDEKYLKNLKEDQEGNAIGKYLLIVQLYEYLAFAHALTFSKIPWQVACGKVLGEVSQGAA